MSDSITEAHARVEAAQAELASAQAEHQQQRRAGLITELAAVRMELTQARDRHAELQQRIHIDRDTYDNAQNRVRRAFEQVADSERARPSIVDFLPDDPEAVQWLKHHKALEARRDRLMAERDALPDPNTTASECNRYLGATGILMQLEFTQANLIRAIEGKSGIVRMEGGVFGVV